MDAENNLFQILSSTLKGKGTILFIYLPLLYLMPLLPIKQPNPSIPPIMEMRN